MIEIHQLTIIFSVLIVLDQLGCIMSVKSYYYKYTVIIIIIIVDFKSYALLISKQRKKLPKRIVLVTPIFNDMLSTLRHKWAYHELIVQPDSLENWTIIILLLPSVNKVEAHWKELQFFKITLKLEGPMKTFQFTSYFNELKKLIVKTGIDYRDKTNSKGHKPNQICHK